MVGRKISLDVELTELRIEVREKPRMILRVFI